MKVYWDKTAVIGLVGFTISLLLILCFMDSLSHPLVGIFLCLFGILLCGIYGALPKAGSPERQKKKEKEKENENKNKISSFYAFSVLFCLVVSIFSLVIGLILAFIGNGEASYICAAIFGVSFAAFLLGSWWKTTSIASKADWSDWGWLQKYHKITCAC